MPGRTLRSALATPTFVAPALAALLMATPALAEEASRPPESGGVTADEIAQDEASAEAEAEETEEEARVVLMEGFGNACRRPAMFDFLGEDPGERVPESHHGLWLPLGACGHDYDISLEAGFGDLAVVPVVTARAVALRFGRTWLGFTGSFAASYAPAWSSAVTATAVEILVGATSDSGRWNLWVTGTYVFPSGVDGSPTDWNVAVATVLTHRPYDGVRAMPRGPATFLGALDIDFRTADTGFLFIGHLAMRAGFVEAASQFGELSGYTGSIALEGYFAYASSLLRDPLASFRVGLRAEIDLSTFWPTNTVAPMAGTLQLGWVPLPALVIEGWGGVGAFPLHRSDIPGLAGVGGLRITFQR